MSDRFGAETPGFDEEPLKPPPNGDGAKGKANGHANGHDDDAPTADRQPWPEPLGMDAYHGLAGEIVLKILPETEADSAALLLQFLVAFGSIIGSQPHARVEGDRHPPRLFAVMIGRTAKGRKGTSWGRVCELLERVAPDWDRDRKISGLSSGEGLIHALRDPAEDEEGDRKGNKGAGDRGVTDKRLLVFEGEVAKVLRSMERQGNTLSAVLRDAWDHGHLRVITRNNPIRATGAHVSLVGHVTADELRRYLDRTEMANGLANRLLYVCVQRSKLLPRGGKPVDWSTIAPRLRAVLEKAPRGEVCRTEAFWALWEEVYPDLSADRPGMLGAILGRAEAQVLRLALIYALLDGSAFLDAVHLRAALACWRYCEASARFVFGDALGDPLADEILRALREQPAGMTRTELMNHFGRNQSSDQIGRALGVLAAGNFVRSETQATGGRPVQRWWAVR